MRDAVVRNRRALIIAYQAALVVVANYVAFWLRFDGQIPAQQWTHFALLLPLLVLLRLVVFVPFGLFRDVWRYAGMWESRNLLLGVGASSVGFYLVVHGALGIVAYPRSVLIVDPLIVYFLMEGSRLVPRLRRKLTLSRRDRRMLVYGAGDAGEMVVRDMRNNPSYEHEPIGYVDDDAAKTGMRIHGLPVLGTGEQLAEIVSRHGPDEVLVAIPSADPTTIRRILARLQPFKLPIKTLPNLREIVSGRARMTDVRDLSLEDLLPRAAVGLDLEAVGNLLRGRRVLVTGAAGSIGSEICRQVARLEPAKLILLDTAESGLYTVAGELARTSPECPRKIVLGNVRNAGHLFESERPEIVFHAAAYKHVPMLEHHPIEAVFNNVIGTMRAAELSVEYGVERFVLISSDKAANPVSVMGATKRVSELWLSALTRSGTAGSTTFAAVRFGNVLGSNGSVVPLFLEQIRAGGPVTVTHPDVARYFMTIPEAVQLVLVSATIARGGETFVLQMGDQIKIVDLARHLIRLAGFVPDSEIRIQYIGLRPGEKLTEDLLAAGERLEASGQEKIYAVHSQEAEDFRRLGEEIAALERHAAQGDGESVRAALRRITSRSTEPVADFAHVRSTPAMRRAGNTTT